MCRKSLEEHEAEKSKLDSETQELEKALAESSFDKDRLEAEKWQEHLKMQEALKMPPESAGEPPASVAEGGPGQVGETLKQDGID